MVLKKNLLYQTASHCTINVESEEVCTGKIGRTEATELLDVMRFIDFKAKETSRPSTLMLKRDNVCLHKMCLLLRKRELKGWLHFSFHKGIHALFEATVWLAFLVVTRCSYCWNCMPNLHWIFNLHLNLTLVLSILF